METKKTHPAGYKYADVSTFNTDSPTPCALNHANITEPMLIKIHVAFVIIVSISVFPKPWPQNRAQAAAVLPPPNYFPQLCVRKKVPSKFQTL